MSSTRHSTCLLDEISHATLLVGSKYLIRVFDVKLSLIDRVVPLLGFSLAFALAFGFDCQIIRQCTGDNSRL